VPARGERHVVNGVSADVGCTDGDYGIYGARGTVGASGQGIGHISEAGYEADWAGDGGWGTPGQGGGGGGGRRGGLGVCGPESPNRAAVHSVTSSRLQVGDR
jgi:hypothetical protein